MNTYKEITIIAQYIHSNCLTQCYYSEIGCYYNYTINRNDNEIIIILFVIIINYLYHPWNRHWMMWILCDTWCIMLSCVRIMIEMSRTCKLQLKNKPSFININKLFWQVNSIRFLKRSQIHKNREKKSTLKLSCLQFDILLYRHSLRTYALMLYTCSLEAMK